MEGKKKGTISFLPWPASRCGLDNPISLPNAPPFHPPCHWPALFDPTRHAHGEYGWHHRGDPPAHKPHAQHRSARQKMDADRARMQAHVPYPTACQPSGPHLHCTLHANQTRTALSRPDCPPLPVPRRSASLRGPPGPPGSSPPPPRTTVGPMSPCTTRRPLLLRPTRPAAPRARRRPSSPCPHPLPQGFA